MYDRLIHSSLSMIYIYIHYIKSHIIDRNRPRPSDQANVGSHSVSQCEDASSTSPKKLASSPSSTRPERHR